MRQVPTERLVETSCSSEHLICVLEIPYIPRRQVLVEIGGVLKHAFRKLETCDVPQRYVAIKFFGISKHIIHGLNISNLWDIDMIVKWFW